MSMTIREFARQLSISDGAVRKAIKSGRIPQEALGEVTAGSRTMPTIENPDLAARCYNKGTQHAKGHQAGRGNPVQLETSKAVFAREMYKAKREQLLYEREAGLSVTRTKLALLISEASKVIKKIVPAKYHAAIDKALQALKDDIDRQPESES